MDVRKLITARIMEKIIEGGMPPWRAGWASNQMHFNNVSMKPYQGVNQVLTGGMSGFGDPRWMTFKQAQAKGLHVRKGEKSTKICRLVEVERKRAGTLGEESEVLAQECDKLLVLKLYDIFNASQIEGMEPLPARTHAVDRIEAAEGIVEGMKKTGLAVLYGADAAYYAPQVDTIRMPPRGAFFSTEDLYGTLLHECSHATGAKHRLNRLVPSARIGSEDYAAEELVAELAACFALADLGMTLGEHHENSHAKYIEHYLNVFKADSGALFRAAGAAQHAADYLREHAIMPEPLPVQTPATESEPVPEMQFAHSAMRRTFRP